MLGSKYPITDVCMTVRGPGARDRIFTATSSASSCGEAPRGFADFKAEKVTFALWEIGHIAEHVGYDGVDDTDMIRKCMVALEVATRDDLGHPLRYTLGKRCAVPGAAEGISMERLLLLLQRSRRQSLGNLHMDRRAVAEGYHDLHD